MTHARLEAEKPRAANLQTALSRAQQLRACGDPDAFVAAANIVHAAIEADKSAGAEPVPLATLAALRAAADADRKAQEDYVRAMVRRRLGEPEVVLLGRLDPTSVVRLAAAAATRGPNPCRCSNRGPCRHEPPQHVLSETLALAAALFDISQRLAADAARRVEVCATLHAAQDDFEVGLARRCAVLAAHRSEGTTAAAIVTARDDPPAAGDAAAGTSDVLAQVLALTRSELAPFDAAHAAMTASAATAESLHELVRPLAMECEASWRRWQDRLSVPGAMTLLQAVEVERLLSAIGRCHLVQPLRAMGLETGAQLLKASEGLLLRKLTAMPTTAEQPTTVTFADVRTLKLAAASLEAGMGLPAWLAVGGTVDDLAESADARRWSVKAVKQYWEGRSGDGRCAAAAAVQCTALGITGAVLLSLTNEDIGAQLDLGEGVHTIELAQEFAVSVAALRLHGDAAAAAGAHGGPTTGGSAGATGSNVASPLANVAATDARLGAAVMQALLDERDVASGAPRPPPPQFPLSYLRRCTHGFDAAHEIGTGSFSTVCVVSVHRGSVRLLFGVVG